ncbi:MAG TPA: hypothetical protein P5250_00620 [Bacteroidales bacterium]|nr:hypothetical protein [Bacteroidales bacterium]
MQEIRILGIYIEPEFKYTQLLQDIFSMYGCIIRTRLGLNDVGCMAKRNTGRLILLELVGNYSDMLNLESELKKLKGLQVDKMLFLETS